MREVEVYGGMRIRMRVEAADCRILHLPTKSPHVGPLDPASSEMKRGRDHPRLSSFRACERAT